MRQRQFRSKWIPSGVKISGVRSEGPPVRDSARVGHDTRRPHCADVLATLRKGALTWLAGHTLLIGGNDLIAELGVTMMRLGSPAVGFVGGCVILNALGRGADR